MTELSVFDFLIPLGVTVGVWITGLIVRHYLFRYLHRIAAQTEWAFDDIVIKITRGPFVIWALMLGIYIALQISRLPDPVVNELGKLLLGLAILSVTLVIANILAELILRSATKAQVPTPQLIPNITKAVVIGLGVLVLLGTLGIQITPILTAFGIGGLAVALALQDTLSNLFAGFYTTLAKQVRVGDFIRLDSGIEGQVVDISWRTTTVRDPFNNLIVIPNTKLSQSIITNYALPEPALTLRLPVGVSYDSDPEHVERVLLEIAKGAQGQVSGMEESVEPVVRFTGFGESALEFVLIVRVKAFQDQFTVAHELRKRIFKRFREEGIEIPFPVRTVYLHHGR
ncbi:MAG: mechanosensitive ion channel family protein [Candidatus Bipolaricaulota bacterium]|nr:mechanosensitive ion channel family protein [Candidatus Bipolaricaulota bacterium]MCS7274723.1 mechanosensitive ion channel family protein [Candidatus Bipolaricaulota bacterium]MDW8110001.1 mechanosensitive ion channel family protein [Candidatus Bipolaricaulota bacterium]MDW8328927.1 mechanosensitive ion channel family protein [Candidatus Bipolaricaulota bacterium]